METSKMTNLTSQKATAKDPLTEKMDMLIKKMDILNEKLDALLAKEGVRHKRDNKPTSVRDIKL